MAELDFNTWVARKDKYDKAASILFSLNEDRAEDEESWFEAAVALAATDCMLKVGRTEKCDCKGLCRIQEHMVTRQRKKCQCSAPKCFLCNRCVGTQQGSISRKMEECLKPFREIPQECITTTARKVLSSGEGAVLNNNRITGGHIRVAVDICAQCSVAVDASGKRNQRPCNCSMRSLADLWVKWSKKYHTFDNVRISEEKAQAFGSGTREMMTYDKKDGCFYMTLKWRVPAKAQKGDTAKIAARRQLSPDEKKQNALFLSLCRQSWERAQLDVVKRLEKQLEAATTENESKSDENNPAVHSPAAEIRVLYKVGLLQLRKWIEEDAEAIEERKRQEDQEKAEQGSLAHQSWVRNKDRLRIRLPPQSMEKIGGSSKPQRFDFSSGKGSIRKTKPKIPNTSMDLMKNSGLKYVHAIRSEGKNSELQRCRQKLLEKGFVHKVNFSEEDQDHYLTERERNLAITQKKSKANSRDQQSKASFDDWLDQKHQVEKAMDFLKKIPPPCNQEDAKDALEIWESVGKSLKAIDRTLLGEWIKWTSTFASATTCRMKWESYPPVACDIHCTSSAIRNILLKLLHRRKVNFKKAFVDTCNEKMVKEGRADEADDMTVEEKAEHYNSLTSREFRKFLRTLGIVLQREEADRLVDCFDANGDGKISMKEFLAVTGEKRGVKCHGDTKMALSDICMWETVCHECGMANAYQLVSGSVSQGGRQRAELPDHIKRRQNKGLKCEPVLSMRDVKDIAPTACEFSLWERRDRLKGLDRLRGLGSECEADSLARLITDGSPPGAPSLFRDEDDALDPTTMILLRWDPPKIQGNNGPAFYILERSDSDETLPRNVKGYNEIYRDPKSFDDNNGEPRYQFVVTGLSPSCKYSFRIRAINGFGAGPYSSASFMTTPEPPPLPTVLHVSMKNVTLSWQPEDQNYERRIKELKEIFDEADTDGSGSISRDEFVEELESRFPRLLNFLQRVKASSGDDTETVRKRSIYEAMETDDNENISWDEFIGYFRSGLYDKPKTGRKTQPCKFILKRCINEAEGVYEEIYHGSNPKFVVHGLEPAHTYQFRVQAVNNENMQSLHSEPVVVNTQLSRPQPPIVTGYPTPNSLKLKWRDAVAKDAHRDDISKLLEEWATGKHCGRTRQDHINLRGKFERYDCDHDGFIDLAEFKILLDELGVRATDDRISAYLDEFDVNSDGRISFEEFCEWWHKDNVTYILKRSDYPTTAPTVASVVCYRGEDRGTIVSGLQANTLYQFALRHESSRTKSPMSKSIEAMTSPSPPSRIAIMYVGAVEIQLKWYGGYNGANKYVLEQRVDPCSHGTRGTGLRQAWRVVYEGKETTTLIRDLQASSSYQYRVFAMNIMGAESDFSEILRVTTEAKEGARSLIPSKAADHFTIECNSDEDIVPGDTILFTERIRGDTKKNNNYKPSASISSVLSSSPSNQGDSDVVGERTIAAEVLRAPGGKFDMNVLWSTFEIYDDAGRDKKSTKSRYSIIRNTTISRRTKQIFRYEVFRVRWVDEDARHADAWVKC